MKMTSVGELRDDEEEFFSALMIDECTTTMIQFYFFTRRMNENDPLQFSLSDERRRVGVGHVLTNNKKGYFQNWNQTKNLINILHLRLIVEIGRNNSKNTFGRASLRNLKISHEY